jgi:hypothetical protein
MSADPMLDAPGDGDASLPEFLATRARHASDARLAIDVGAGLVVASAAVLWRGTAWVVIASAAGCFLAYGGWGIADRELGEREPTGLPATKSLRAARAAAAVTGAIAAIALLISGLAVAFGSVKS